MVPASVEGARGPRPGLFLALALLLVAAAHANSLSGGFVWDDHWLIEEQEVVRQLHPVGDYFRRMFWSNPLDSEVRTFYRPLTTLSFAVDYWAGDGSPSRFHLTNLLLHLACTALVFQLARKAQASAIAAALAASAFGVAPRLTESVTWISGRTDLLAGGAVLAALLLHPQRGGQWIARSLAGLLLFTGLLCKEVAVAGVVGICFLEAANARRERSWRALAGALPAALGAGLYLLLRHTFQAGASPGYSFSAAMRAALVLQTIGEYARMLVDFLHPELQIGVLGIVTAPEVAAGAAVLVAALALAVRSRRWPLLVRVFAVVGATALALVLQVVPLPLHVVAADRFLYLPLACLACVGASLGAGAAAKTQRWLGGAVALGVVLSWVGTHARIEDWNDELRLWTIAAAHADECNGLPEGMRAGLLLDDHRLVEAEAAFRQAIRRDTLGAGRYGWENARELPASMTNLALTLERLDRAPEALATLDRVLAARPGHRRARVMRVLILARQGDFALASEELQALRAAEPAEPLWREMTAELDAFRATLERLGPETDSEPTEAVVRRAEAYLKVGGTLPATRLWGRVVERTDARPEDLLRAASWLVLNADLASAVRATSRATAAGLPADQLALLAEALDARRHRR